MKTLIGWLIAVVVIGLVCWVVEKIAPMEGSFALVFRVMCGIAAFVCFIAFLIALLKFAAIPTPW